LPKQAQCRGSTSGLFTESVAGNNTLYARCMDPVYDPYVEGWPVNFYDSGPGGAGYYPGSDPLPWREECWKGLDRQEPIPGNQVTLDVEETQWIVYSPVDPNIAYFSTVGDVVQIKMIDFSTPDNMVTLIAGALPGAVPGDTRYPEDQGCYVDVFNVSEETNSTELLQWRYTYRSYETTDNSTDPTDGEVFEPGVDYHFFNATVSPQGCGTEPPFRFLIDQVAMLPAPAKDWCFGDWYDFPIASSAAITSDGEMMYLMMRDDEGDDRRLGPRYWFNGILALNLTSGNMSKVVNFLGEENFGTPWYNDNPGNDIRTGTMQLSHDDSTLYIMTNGDWAHSRSPNGPDVWSLNLVTGEFKMIFDIYDSFDSILGPFDSAVSNGVGPMVLAPDGKKMWFVGDMVEDGWYSFVGFMNMEDFSGAIVYDRAAAWGEAGFAQYEGTFQLFSYPFLSMTPDSKNLVIYGMPMEMPGKISIMPTTPPYNMHSIIGSADYVMPGMGGMGGPLGSAVSGIWESGGEWTFACPDRTCDGPVGFANWAQGFGAMSPDGSFILAVEGDEYRKFRKIYIDNRCKVATCG
jgi:hypothetical protein